MGKDEARHEQVSSQLLGRRFAGVDALARYLEEAGVQFILNEDSIAPEPPHASGVAWSPKDGIYYLVLLPRNPRKLYRFRVYPTAMGGLHFEKDFAYKNPYQ